MVEPRRVPKGRLSRSAIQPSLRDLIVSITPDPRLKPWAFLGRPSGTHEPQVETVTGGTSNPSEAGASDRTRISRINTDFLFSCQNLTCLRHVLRFKDSSGIAP